MTSPPPLAREDITPWWPGSKLSWHGMGPQSSQLDCSGICQLFPECGQSSAWVLGSASQARPLKGMGLTENTAMPAALLPAEVGGLDT
jgi:hypothetical protein